VPDGSANLTPFLDAARDGAAGFAGAGTSWVDDLRAAGASAYDQHGLPQRADEYWRYTNLNALSEGAFGLTVATPVPAELPPDVPAFDAYRFVMADGRAVPGLSDIASLPDGVEVASLSALLSEAPERLEPWLGRIAPLPDMPMAALNTGFLGDGLVLIVDAGTVLDRPLHLVSLTSGADGRPMIQPRHLVVLGAGSQAHLIETHSSSAGGAGFTNGVTEISLGGGAHLVHLVDQAEENGRVFLSGTAAHLDAGSRYDSFVMQRGGAIGRSEIRVVLNGPDAECRLDGVYLGTGEQVLDNTTYVEHAAPGCRSRQVYKGVLDEKARGVFQGKVHVVRDAQKTDGHQLSRALLLSPNAEIDARPELEIYADDVKCSHGATAGELDETALFYLLSRGIPAPVARRMLIEAFLSEAVEDVAYTPVADHYSACIGVWLAANIDTGEGQ
jgi:Fe-S cluster assembly protein SufD